MENKKPLKLSQVKSLVENLDSFLIKNKLSVKYDTYGKDACELRNYAFVKLLNNLKVDSKKAESDRLIKKMIKELKLTENVFNVLLDEVSSPIIDTNILILTIGAKLGAEIINKATAETFVVDIDTAYKKVSGSKLISYTNRVRLYHGSPLISPAEIGEFYALLDAKEYDLYNNLGLSKFNRNLYSMPITLTELLNIIAEQKVEFKDRDELINIVWFIINKLVSERLIKSSKSRNDFAKDFRKNIGLDN